MTDDECVSIARRECESRGWTWIEPYRIIKGWFKWTVVTNAASEVKCHPRILESWGFLVNFDSTVGVIATR